MSDQIEKTAQQFQDLYNQLSPELIRRINTLNFDESLEEWEDFRTNFDKGICYLCKRPLTLFSIPSDPCLHWLLRPNGAKKKHIIETIEKHGYVHTDAYLRWVASTETPIFNINDLKQEKDSKFIIQHTIKYLPFLWSFSCAKSDLNGHPGNINYPHFHFEMKINNKPFIKFQNYHFKFTDYDIFWIAVEHKTTIPTGKLGPGMGMGSLEDSSTLEQIISSSLKTAKSENEGDLHMSTTIIANEGESIPGELIYQASEAANANGTTLTYELRRIFPNAMTIVEPTEKSPQISKRPKTKRSGKR